MVGLVKEKVKSDLPVVKKLVAKVKAENVASIRVFTDNGFSDVYHVLELNVKSAVSPSKDGINTAFERCGGVIFLTNNGNSLTLYDWLLEQGERVVLFSDKIELSMVEVCQPDLVISYNYNYIVGRDVIDFMQGRIINLHVSMLPWNRGSSPNFWSFVDNTPKGVTIHRIAEKLDAGEILLQQSVSFDETKESLKSSYDTLQLCIQRLFKENWEQIKYGKITGYYITEQGSYHCIRDFNVIRDRIDGFSWNMKVCDMLEALK